MDGWIDRSIDRAIEQWKDGWMDWMDGGFHVLYNNYFSHIRPINHKSKISFSKAGPVKVSVKFLYPIKIFVMIHNCLTETVLMGMSHYMLFVES